MQKFSTFVVRFRYVFLGVFAAVLIASLFMMPHVSANYDIASYLPDDMETRQALTVIEDEFGMNSFVNVMVKNVDKSEACALASELGDLPNVQLMSFNENSAQYYKDGCMLVKLVAAGDDYSATAQSVVTAAQSLLQEKGYTFYMSGSAVDGTRIQNGIGGEMTLIMTISVCILVAILLLSSRSWFEPIIFLLVVGVAILINLGTNLILGEVSYITKSVAAILQLALAMDYSIVLLHNFDAFVEKGERATDAAAHALAVSVKPIISSSLTTVAGLVALMFMSFGIGLDIGLVMSKGILVSMLSVFFMMPGLLVLFHKPLHKLRHKPLPLGDAQLAKGVIKARFVVPVLLVGLIIVGAVMQSFNVYSFGEYQPSVDKAEMERVFGPPESTMIILVPRVKGEEDYDTQDAVIEKIAALEIDGKSPFLSSQTYRNTLASLPPITQWMPSVKQRVNALFNGTEHSRLLVSFNFPEQGALDYIDEIKAVLEAQYGQDVTLMAGGPMTNYDISKAFDRDRMVTNVISILAILLIIGLAFRSVSLPALLVLIIQGAIWAAMSVAFLMAQPIFFMSYLIASAILMGATIDYAILITDNYVKARKTAGKLAALKIALSKSMATVLTSGLILTIAGFVVGCISSSNAISTIGLLLGRGALAAMVLVLVLLPELLYLLDTVIQKSSFGLRFAPADAPAAIVGGVGQQSAVDLLVGYARESRKKE